MTRRQARSRLRRTTREALRRVALRTCTTLPLSGLIDARRHDQPLRNIVVVTGPHRSGTTIMGRLLLHASRTFLVYEPFNVDWGLEGVPHRYPYLRAQDVDHPAAQVLRHFLRTGEGQWLGDGRRLPAHHRRMRANRNNIRGMRPLGYTAIVKDPFMMLSLGWINQALSTNPVVVTLRHPCAWVASLVRRSMHPRAAVRSFRAQDGYGDPVVREILDQRDWEQADVIDAGAATWAILVRMLDVQAEAGARFHLVKMEDFASDPYAVILQTYEKVSLTPPRNLERIVEEYTGAHNVVTPDEPVLHVLRRNSAALVDAWRTKLSAQEQKRVREITEPMAGGRYDTW
ncbi:MAG TPA: sulfotransferase [Actinopolymorphaceae bacterium]